MLLSPNVSAIRCDRTRNQRGFTLIELIVVTTLIAIMLSISIPSLRDAFLTDPLKTTTRKIIGLVEGVREMAVRTQQPYLLYISQLENRIWYEKEDRGQEELEEKEKDPLLGGEFTFPESVKISGIQVEKAGISSSGQTVVWISMQGYMAETLLRLEDDGGDHLNVQFYPFLGAALVSDQDASF